MKSTFRIPDWAWKFIEIDAKKRERSNFVSTEEQPLSWNEEANQKVSKRLAEGQLDELSAHLKNPDFEMNWVTRLYLVSMIDGEKSNTDYDITTKLNVTPANSAPTRKAAKFREHFGIAYFIAQRGALDGTPLKDCYDLAEIEFRNGRDSLEKIWKKMKPLMVQIKEAGLDF